MKYKKYAIADTAFGVKYSPAFTDMPDSVFTRNNDNSILDPEVKIEITVDDTICRKFMPGTGVISGIRDEKSYSVYMSDHQGFVAHCIEADEEWREISVSSSMPQLQPFEGGVGEVIFRTAVLFSKGIVIHAAAIVHEGKGLIFSAPSGTGKSTQADLWKKYRGAQILNGDRPCLRQNGGQVYVYGTPWSGTSKQYLNKKAPLSAIFILRQAPVNKIHRLSAEEAVRMTVPRCYLPYYDESLMTLALSNIGEIIGKTPVFLLNCRPNLEAVELAESCI